MSAAVRVYVAPGCGPCAALKGALDRAGVRYDVQDASALDAATLDDWRAKGWRTPVVSLAGAEEYVSADRIRAVVDRARRA